MVRSEGDPVQLCRVCALPKSSGFGQSSWQLVNIQESLLHTTTVGLTLSRLSVGLLYLLRCSIA